MLLRQRDRGADPAQSRDKRLIQEGKACKNGFRRQCIAQEVERLQKEYSKIDELF
jgi:hypothetical protein